MRFRAAAVLALTAVSGSSQLVAQQSPQASAPAIDFSGVLFGNFQYRTDSAAKAQSGGKSPNKFDIERVYLTFRMPAGDKTSIRITTDIFQNTAGGYYAGWAVRLKYGIVARELSRNTFGVAGLTSAARVGMLPTVVIDHVESHWPRSLGVSALERAGFFSSSDVGVATSFTLPNKRGEIYVTVLNGSGYTVGENDRFKDVAARFTFTPFANRSSMIKSLAITPWFSKGYSASTFVLGGGTQVGPVSEGVQKDRRGVFVGLKDRRLTGGFEFAQRADAVESGNNTVAVPRVVTDRTSNLVSVFALVRPMEWINKDRQSPVGLLIRNDNFKIDNSASPATRFSVLGAFWDLGPKSTITLNVQSLDRLSGSTAVPFRTLFVHWKQDY
jgi:hypothetical protein